MHVGTRDNTGRNAFNYAFIGGNEEVVQILVEHDPVLISPDTLLLAAQKKQAIILDVLIRAHRKGGMQIHAESTKELLHRAQRRAKLSLDWKAA